jgi:hypothetical protein
MFEGVTIKNITDHRVAGKIFFNHSSGPTANAAQGPLEQENVVTPIEWPVWSKP